MGRASGIVSGESDSRLRDGNLSRGREGGSIGSRDSGGSRGGSNRSSGISSYRGSSVASSIASWDTSESLVGSAIGKTSSIDLDRVSNSIGGSHAGRENDKLVHGDDCWFGS